MGGLAGLRRAPSSSSGGEEGGGGKGKAAKDLAGARPAGGVEISLEMLQSVKLNASAEIEPKPKPKVATPEMMKARSRLKRIQRAGGTPNNKLVGSPLAVKTASAADLNGKSSPKPRAALGTIKAGSENLRRLSAPAVKEEESTSSSNQKIQEEDASSDVGGGIRASAWRMIWG